MKRHRRTIVFGTISDQVHKEPFKDDEKGEKDTKNFQKWRKNEEKG